MTQETGDKLMMAKKFDPLKLEDQHIYTINSFCEKLTLKRNLCMIMNKAIICPAPSCACVSIRVCIDSLTQTDAATSWTEEDIRLRYYSSSCSYVVVGQIKCQSFARD